MDNTTDEKFQVNLESLNTWVNTLEMSFNAKMCKLIAFQLEGTAPTCTMGDVVPEHRVFCKYLSIILQSDLKFSNSIANKIAVIESKLA